MARGKKYQPEQVVNLLRQIEVPVANGKSTDQACRDAGIVEQTYYLWRKEYGGLQVSRLSSCVTKQIGDMRYSEAEPLRFTAPVLRTKMRYGLESELYCGSAFAVLIELPEGRDVGYRSLS